MRPLEAIVSLGAALLLLGWAAGWRVHRALPLVLGVLVVVHLLVEGQRAVMWPVYALVAGAVVWVLVRRSTRVPSRDSGWRTAVRSFVALILFVVVVTPGWLWPIMKLPAPTGPFPVGTSWIQIADSGRRERFGTTAGAVREFPVKIWYPAATSDGIRAPYSHPLEPSIGGMFPPVLFAQNRFVKTHSFTDAPLAAGSERFPVLVFSHGYSGYAAQNTPQMEELASRGYVVFSISHPGEAAYAPFPDGRGIGLDSAAMASLRSMGGEDPKAMAARMASVMTGIDSAATGHERIALLREFIGTNPEPLRSESVAEWTADTRATVDRIEAFDAGRTTSPFAGRLDVSKLGVFGMSYGGATAGQFCAEDRRCKAGVNMDGGQFGRLVDDSLTVPFLIMGSEQAFTLHKPVLDLMRGPGYLMLVPKTTHLGLTDMTLVAPVLFRYAGITGRLDPDRREAIMTAYLLGFFDRYLRDQPSALFDGGSTDFPEVQLTKRNVP